MKSISIAVLMVLTFNWAQAKSTETREFSAKNIKKISAQNSSGSISVVATASEKGTLFIENIKNEDNCKVVTEEKDGTLAIKVKKLDLFASDCEINFKISAQKNIDLELANGSGDINVNGVSGDLAYKVGSGQVTVDSQVKELEGKSGSGDISIKGLTSNASIKAGSGKISLVYSVAPAVGELDIKTGSGNADVVFPKSAKIHTSFMAGSGAVKNALGETIDSKFKVSMKAGSGNLNITAQ